MLIRTREYTVTDAALNPIIKPLEWMLGSWECDEPGDGTFPTIQPFRYTRRFIFQISRTFRLMEDGRLEQTVCMAKASLSQSTCTSPTGRQRPEGNRGLLREYPTQTT
ncbi:THAP domain-containing protein 4 isoform X5 [Acipenser oxyrinchus oxyrinchus]|uniref:THAP domain-containing protein 4 isoform X5 n=1 Tax=Acipenser oxyrinchus oxyrinchus TaxID=40147 RepID=A0AAD8G8A3_ACIOX|nr:THAP domain-containing protein 4 isoform X5 [Acipenser oxyrinchus oxyrinchus]